MAAGHAQPPRAAFIIRSSSLALPRPVLRQARRSIVGGDRGHAHQQVAHARPARRRKIHAGALARSIRARWYRGAPRNWIAPQLGRARFPESDIGGHRPWSSRPGGTVGPGRAHRASGPSRDRPPGPPAAAAASLGGAGSGARGHRGVRTAITASASHRQQRACLAASTMRLHRQITSPAAAIRPPDQLPRWTIERRHSPRPRLRQRRLGLCLAGEGAGCARATACRKG
jgi:hypothetical protein